MDACRRRCLSHQYFEDSLDTFRGGGDQQIQLRPQVIDWKSWQWQEGGDTYLRICISVYLRATTQKNCPCKNIVREASSEQQHTSKKTPKTHASGSPLPPDPHGVARPYAIILWRTPAKLAGDINLPLLDTSVKAHRLIFIIFNE
jgi:hypothetical protein